ncbi:MAG: sulfatase-like hydrolase/transferase [Planctomycetota bacterium]
MDMNLNRRSFLKFTGLGAASLAWSGCITTHGEPADKDAKKPNIVLVMADDQGWGDTGYNGHERLKTPILDEMASSGLCFDRFYSAAPVCSPTRGSVLTGRHPNRYGCFSWGHTLRPQEVTVAEVLRTAGYRTGHFGKWHLGPVSADSSVSPGNSGFDEWFSSPNFFENSPLMSHNGKVVETEGEGSLVTVEAALKFIRDSAGSEQPFLAVVWFGSPHSPYVALPEDRELYKDLPTNLQNYYGEITAMDRAVGLLRRELRELGIAENTLLWYTSDNGGTGPGSTGGLSGKKGSLWEGGLRVPAIIEWPARIKSPAQTSIPCCTVDIYPTLLEIVGAKVERQPKPLDGISLLPLFKGTMKVRSKPLGFWVYPEPGRGVKSTQILEELAKEQAGGAPSTAAKEAPAKIARQYPEEVLPGHAAWLDNDYKLHRIPDKKGQVSYALFDLAKDPNEKKDLAASEPRRLERMKAELEIWQKSVIKSLNGGDYHL